MRRCSTEVIALLCAAALAAVPARAEEAWRGSMTPGLTLHFPSDHFGESDAGTWLDQYQYMAHAGDPVPWFLDLMHAEGGVQRDDETWLLHLERSSPFAWGETSWLDVDWRGLRVEGSAWRWRTEELRLFPVGTGDTGFSVLPRLGSHWNDGSPPDDRFPVRRQGGGGEVRLRPDAFGIETGPLTQLSFYGSQEYRTGDRQDRFLLDGDEVGAGPETARFRGRTRELDQEVTTLGGRAVAVPFGLATSVLDLSWQRFHENAPIALVGQIPDPNVQPTPTAAERALFFVPDTNRMSGALTLSRSIGGATLHGGAFATRLEQTGARPPLQTQADLRGNDVTIWSAHGAADVPITEWLSFDAFGKTAVRENGLDRNTAYFADDNRTQLYPFLRRSVDARAGAELSARPMRGARVGAGWRMRDLDRSLEYPDTIAANGLPQRAIRPAVTLVGGDSSLHEVYARGHARLMKRTRVAGEAGYSWAPAVGAPTEFEKSVFAEGRLSHGLVDPLPMTIALFSHYVNGSADGWMLESDVANASRSKDYEQRTIDWGVSLSAVPRRGTVLYLTVTQQLDRQRFPHVRSNVPRFNPLINGRSPVEFFLDSRLGWSTDSRIVAAGATQQLTRRLDLSLSGWVGLIDGHFPRGGSTADAMESPNEIDLTYGSAEAALGFQVLPALRLGVAYRYQGYNDAARLDEPNRDGQDHAVTLSATYEFALGR